MSEFARFMEKKLGGKYNVSREAGGGGGQGGGEGGGRGGARGGGGGSVLDALLPKKVNEVMEKELLDDSRAKQTRIISSNIGFLSNAQNVEESSSESEEEPAEYGSSIDPKVGDQVEVVSVSGRNRVFNIEHGNILTPNQASTEASVGAHPPETSGAPLPETSAGPPPAKKRKTSKEKRQSKAVEKQRGKARLQQNFRESFLNLKKKISQLQPKHGTTQNFFFGIENNVQNPSVRGAAKTAGKVMVYGGGPLLQQFLRDGIKYDKDIHYVCENDYDFAEHQFSDAD